LKIVFWLYLRDLLSDYCEILCEEAESRSDTGHVTKIPNFENSRWRTATILKMVLSLYISVGNHPISMKFGVQTQILVQEWAHADL